MSHALAAVYAADEAGGIGQGGALPWHLPADMAYFRKLTSEAPAPLQNAVLMGRKTFASIPERFRPLPKRLNIVLSRHGAEVPPGVLMASSIAEALRLVDARGDVHRLFVIGGAEIYAQALADARCTTVYRTQVRGRFPCDAFVPELGPEFVLSAEGPLQHEGALSFSFQTFERHGARS